MTNEDFKKYMFQRKDFWDWFHKISKGIYQPERPNPTAQCEHDWHQEDVRGSNESKTFCAKCNAEMRWPEH